MMDSIELAIARLVAGLNGVFRKVLVCYRQPIYGLIDTDLYDRTIYK